MNLFTVKSIKIGFQYYYFFDRYVVGLHVPIIGLRKSDNDGNELNRSKFKLHHPIFGFDQENNGKNDIFFSSIYRKF